MYKKSHLTFFSNKFEVNSFNNKKYNKEVELNIMGTDLNTWEVIFLYLDPKDKQTLNVLR